MEAKLVFYPATIRVSKHITTVAREENTWNTKVNTYTKKPQKKYRVTCIDLVSKINETLNTSSINY